MIGFTGTFNIRLVYTFDFGLVECCSIMTRIVIEQGIVTKIELVIEEFEELEDETHQLRDIQLHGCSS
jgi:hypothetical protein